MNNTSLESDRLKKSEEKYSNKVNKLTDGTIKVISYSGSKQPVDLICTVCGNRWSCRADNFLSRCWCPSCGKRIINEKLNPRRERFSIGDIVVYNGTRGKVERIEDVSEDGQIVTVYFIDGPKIISTVDKHLKKIQL